MMPSMTPSMAPSHIYQIMLHRLPHAVVDEQHYSHILPALPCFAMTKCKIFIALQTRPHLDDQLAS